MEPERVVKRLTLIKSIFIKRYIMTSRLNSLLLISLILLTGCGKTEKSDPPATAMVKMQEIGRMYKGYTTDHKKPPKNLIDFNHPYEPANMEGYTALRDGESIMLWGGKLPGKNADSIVLAYEKEAPNNGGLVLFQDGTIKTLTAEEFNAAPKNK